MRPAGALLVVAAAALALSSACSRRGPRDVGNQNPRSEFEDGPGAAGPRDASADGPERVVAAPTTMGKKPREIAKASSRALATDATRIYFGDDTDDVLLSISKARANGDEPVRIARRAPMPGALALDTHEAALAWIGTPGDVVLRVPTTGGVPTTVRDRGIFTDVTATGGDVFFTEAQGSGGTLTRVTGTTTARLASFEGTPRGIVVDSDTVYVATSTRLYAAPRTRGELVDLANGAGFASPVVDGASLYAVAVDPKSRARRVVRVKKTGGALETIATGVRDAPIALHKGSVYWFDAERPALLSSSFVDTPNRRSAASTHVVSNDVLLEGPSALAVDDDGAFIATGHGESGRILVVPFR